MVTIENSDDLGFLPGASKWPEQFPSYCNGSRQSPINIVSEKAAYKSNIGVFTFNNYSSDPENLTLPVNNTGHSITVFVADLKASISGAGLTAAYNAYQLHLHWGKDASSGSEHEIDGKKYVGEVRRPIPNDAVGMNQVFTCKTRGPPTARND